VPFLHRGSIALLVPAVALSASALRTFPGRPGPSAPAAPSLAGGAHHPAPALPGFSGRTRPSAARSGSLPGPAALAADVPGGGASRTRIGPAPEEELVPEDDGGSITLCCLARGGAAPLPGVILGLERIFPEGVPPEGPPATEAPALASVTDAAGAVTFSGLAPGRYRASVSDERFLPPEPLEAAVPPGTDHRLPCFALIPASAILGRVVLDLTAVEPAGRTETAGGDGRRGLLETPGAGGAPEAGPAPGGPAQREADDASRSAESAMREGSTGGAALDIDLTLYPWDDSDTPIAHARPDPRSGAFRFPRLDPSARYALAVPGPRCLELAQRELRAGGAPLVVRSGRGESLRLEVVESASGAPVPDVEVTAAPPTLPLDRPLRGAELACLVNRRDASGRGELTLSGLPRGEVRMAVRAPGFAPLTARVTLPRDPDSPLLLRLDRQPCREVAVQDAATGLPLERAEIVTEPAQFEDAGSRRLLPPIVTDRDGRGRFCPAYPGDRDFYVRAAGRAPRRIELPPGPGPEPLVVALSEGGSVTGRVRDADGMPLSGVRISARVLGCVFGALTGADGRYSLTALPPGLVVVLREGAAGSREASRQVGVEEGRTAQLDFGGRPGALFRIEDRGSPVADREGVWRGGPETGSETRSVRTDGEGTITFPLGGRGASTLALREGGTWIFLRVPGGEAAADPGEARLLRYPDRRFAGRLVDESGAAVAGARVLASAGGGTIDDGGDDALSAPPLWIDTDGSLVTTDPGGRFTSLVPAGARGIYAVLPEGESRYLALPDGPGGDLLVVASGRIRVAARGAGAPISAALVREGERSFSISASGPEESELDLKAPEGLYTLVVWEPGFAPFIEPRLRLAAGDAIARRVELEEGGVLRLRFDEPPRDDPFARPGFLSLDGFDLTWLTRGLIPVEIAAPRDGAMEEAAGMPAAEFLLTHVPPGTIVLGCASGPKAIRITSGAPSIVACPPPPP
jgi:hypothetical protein